MKESHPLRWIVPILYTVAADALWFVILFGMGTSSEEDDLSPYAESAGGGIDPLAVWLGVLAIALVACVIEVIVVSIRKREGYLTFLRRAMLLVKLGLIPFFLLGALLMAFAGILSIHPVLFMAGWMAAAMCAAAGWVIMLAGSAWAIAYAAGMRGRLTTAETTVHIVLQFLFVADVVDAIILFIRGRNLEASEPEDAPKVPTPAPQAPPSPTGMPRV